ncbi:hypothetical protein GOBAR_AA16247 [Gossypium barbadense]|uniref:Uncharacterized protein n=1 Tax=Gossypium barbadense TaxID=3634 RepID=A0A2P5XM69_GOSBA|nr:hypothetical protein GOBAR_AA16247 [Gossypium barbadense]
MLLRDDPCHIPSRYGWTSWCGSRGVKGWNMWSNTYRGDPVRRPSKVGSVHFFVTVGHPLCPTLNLDSYVIEPLLTRQILWNLLSLAYPWWPRCEYGSPHGCPKDHQFIEIGHWAVAFLETNCLLGSSGTSSLKGRRTVENGNRNSGGDGGFWHIMARTIYNRRLITMTCSGLSGQGLFSSNSYVVMSWLVVMSLSSYHEEGTHIATTQYFSSQCHHLFVVCCEGSLQRHKASLGCDLVVEMTRCLSSG